jgi:SPP1 gp7 family putative phage head morphogenesis protein
MSGTLPPAEWARLARQVEGRAKRLWDARWTPTPSWLTQHATLVAQMEALIGTVGGDAARGAALYGDDFLPAMERARDLLVNTVPSSTRQAVDEFARIVGKPVADPNLLRSVVNRTGQAILSDWGNLSADVRATVADTIASSVAAGDSPASLARSLSRDAQMVQWRASTIARTELMSAHDDVQHLLYEQLGVEQWVWRARPDACGICFALHGQRFAVYEAAGRHPNCRCMMIPVVDGVKAPKPNPVAEVNARFPQRLQMTRLDRGDLMRRLVVNDNPKWKPSWGFAPPGTTKFKKPVPPRWRRPDGTEAPVTPEPVAIPAPPRGADLSGPPPGVKEWAPARWAGDGWAEDADKLEDMLVRQVPRDDGSTVLEFVLSEDAAAAVESTAGGAVQPVASSATIRARLITELPRDKALIRDEWDWVMRKGIKPEDVDWDFFVRNPKFTDADRLTLKALDRKARMEYSMSRANAPKPTAGPKWSVTDANRAVLPSPDRTQWTWGSAGRYSDYASGPGKTLAYDAGGVEARLIRVADESNGQYSLRNTVMVRVPRGKDVKAVFDDVARSLGVEPGTPTPEALRAMLDRKVASVFRPKLTDAGRVPSKAQITRMWNELEADYGFGPDDIEWEVNPWDGRPMPLLPRRVAEAIAKQAGVTHFHHNLSSLDWVAEAFADAAEGGRPFAVVSTERRFSTGIIKGGMSSWDDLDSGGGEYVFTRQRAVEMDNGFSLDAVELLRRLDWFSYTGDKYGVRNPKSWSWNLAKGGTRNLEALKEHSRHNSAETMFKGQIVLADGDVLVVSRWAVRDFVDKLKAAGRWGPDVEALMRRTIKMEGQEFPYTGASFPP